jgi:hypothetical protein
MTRSSASSFILLVMGMFLSMPRIAHAAESYDNCTGFITSIPATITTQGTWCLKTDLATAITSGNAITINTNNVTIDCNNFKLGGLAAGVGSQTVGILATSHLNTTVRHCNIRGFYAGIAFAGTGSGGHVVEDNRFDGNLYIGIDVEADGSTIRRNLVFDTGGSTHTINAEAIYAVGLVDVLDNTISGVLATTGGGGAAQGIYTYSAGGTISGNRVRGLVGDGAGGSYANYNLFSSRVSIHNNDFIGPGTQGLHCFTGDGSFRDNLISGYTASNDFCTDGGGNAIVP